MQEAADAQAQLQPPPQFGELPQLCISVPLTLQAPQALQPLPAPHFSTSDNDIQA